MYCTRITRTYLLLVFVRPVLRLLIDIHALGVRTGSFAADWGPVARRSSRSSLLRLTGFFGWADRMLLIRLRLLLLWLFVRLLLLLL